jgi:hypothetical protein
LGREGAREFLLGWYDRAMTGIEMRIREREKGGRDDFSAIFYW